MNATLITGSLERDIYKNSDDLDKVEVTQLDDSKPEV